MTLCYQLKQAVGIFLQVIAMVKRSRRLFLNPHLLWTDIGIAQFMMSRYKSHNHFRRILRHRYWLFQNKALFLVQLYSSIDLYFTHTYFSHAFPLGQCSLILAKGMLDSLIELYPHLFIFYSQLQIGYRWNIGLFLTIMVAMSHYLMCRLFIGLVDLSICYISLLVDHSSLSFGISGIPRRSLD